jgi:hypothetical protein
MKKLHKINYLKKMGILTLIFLSSIVYTQNTETEFLLGSWVSNGELGTLYLVFYSDTELEFDGEYASYTRLPGILRISDEYGSVDYPYNLHGNNLIISFPEGYQLQFQRVEASHPSLPNEAPEISPQKSVPSLPSSEIAPPVTASAQLSGKEIGDPQWGFAFQPPAGWKYQQSAQGVLLGHDQIAGMIVVFPHTYGSVQAIQQAMTEGLQEEGIMMYPSGQLNTMGQNAITGEYQGTWQGVQARGTGFGTLSPYGGGAMILAVTTPDKFGKQLSDPANQIAQNMRFFAVDASALMQHFAGYWWYYSGTSAISHEKLIHLAPDGTYRDKREDAADVSNLDQYGNVNNQYLGNSQGRSSGRWTPRGNKYEGIIIVTRADGSSFEIEYRVKPSNPQKFGSYYFNGTLYNYATEDQLRMMNY